MERLHESPEVAALIRPVALDGPVVYFPIRHHSPACAWHVDRLIRDWQPDAVLIEGPRDATPLAPMLLHADTRLPVALFTTFIKRGKEHPPEHYAAYYPFCDYSPEYAAVKAGMAVGARVRFIDLTFPEQIACRPWPDGKVQSLLDERYLRHSRFLRAACQRAGMRDPDDLWDHLYEDDYEGVPTEQFMRNVLAYCALARQDYTEEMLQAEGCLPREQAMAAAIAGESGRALVVTGGFHTVALPETTPLAPKALDVAPEDALVVLTRYSFDMLDRLNGYASGMPSPEFYQRRWEGREIPQLIVDIGRRIREQGGEVSADDEIQALAQAMRLADLRGHARPSREDVLDGMRTAFIKGAVDVEGVLVLAHARTVLAGTRVGAVPKSAGLPPIVWDFRETAARFRLKLDGLESNTTTLDLYRKAAAPAGQPLPAPPALPGYPLRCPRARAGFRAGHIPRPHARGVELPLVAADGYAPGGDVDVRRHAGASGHRAPVGQLRSGGGGRAGGTGRPGDLVDHGSLPHGAAPAGATVAGKNAGS